MTWQGKERKGPFCQHINCIPTPWSCCQTAIPGSCTARSLGGGGVEALCNMSNAPPFTASCTADADRACVYPDDPFSTDGRKQLGALCGLICSGCSSPPKWLTSSEDARPHAGCVRLYVNVYVH